MGESAIQRLIIKDIKSRFPGCVVLKNDPTYIQGIPDLLILYGDRWAMLEVKRYKDASRQPNQDAWVCKLNNMSFAKFIYPENKKEIIDELDRYFNK